MTNEARKIMRLYWGLTSLSSLARSFILATYVNYLLAGGLDLFQVNAVNIVYHVVLFLCEIPTGIIADVYGRRLSYIIFTVLSTLGMCLYGTSANFLGFIVAEICLAIAHTFESGAFRAWAIDSLRHIGVEETKKLFSYEVVLSSFVPLLGIVAGAHLATANTHWPWFLGGAIFMLNGLIAIKLMREDYFHRHPVTIANVRRIWHDQWQKTKSHAKQSLVFKTIFIMSFVTTMAFTGLNMQWPVLFKTLTQNQLGYLGQGIALAIMLGGFLSPRLTNLWPDDCRMLRLSFSWIGVGAIVSVSTHNPLVMFAAFLAHEVGRGLIRPILRRVLHDDIKSAERATIDSIGEMAHHFGGVVGLTISGLIGKYYGVVPSWWFSGIILITLAIFIRLPKR